MRNETLLLACGLTVGLVAGFGYALQSQTDSSVAEANRMPPGGAVAEKRRQPTPAVKETEAPTLATNKAPVARPAASAASATAAKRVASASNDGPATAEATRVASSLPDRVAVKRVPPEQVEAQLRRLYSSHWKDRRDGIVALASFGAAAAPAAKRLAELLADHDRPPPPPGHVWLNGPLRNGELAIGALMEIGPPAWEPIGNVMRATRDPFTLSNALGALDSLRPTNLAELCIPLADHSAKEVRIQAINLLGKSGDARAALALRKCLQNSRLSGNERARALESLCNVLNKEALPDLVAGLDDRDLEVRRLAENRLEFSLDSSSIGFLVRMLDEASTGRRLMAAGALARLAFHERLAVRQATRSLMVRAVTDPEYEMRRKATDALAEFHDPEAALLFLAVLNQDDGVQKRSALRGLLNLAIDHALDDSAVKPLAEVVRSDRDSERRSLALEVLYRLAPDGWKVIAQTAGDADPKVQKKIKNLLYLIEQQSRPRAPARSRR
jgi:HEAT repeat protein